jgi:hypothetical protein
MALDVIVASSGQDGFGNVKVNMPLSPAQSGYVMLASDVSETGDPAGRISQEVRVSAQGRIGVGQPVPLFVETFNYTALNTALFYQTVTTQTVVVGGGSLALNASAITTLSTYSSIKTYQYFPLYSDLATYCNMDVALSTAPQVNCVIEFGLFQFLTNAAVTDGVLFRYDSGGTLKCVVNNNGTEYTVTVVSPPAVGAMVKYRIVCEDDRVLFYIDGACVGVINSPAGLGMPVYTAAQPFSARVINGATAPTLATTLKIGYVFVGLQDAGGLGKSISEIAAIAGKSGIQGQSGGTMGQAALLTNVTATVNPAGSAINNATSVYSGLGGLFPVLPTLAQGIDGILGSFLNPVPSNVLTGKTLYIKGVKFHGAVTTILAGGPVLYGYSVAVGSNAVTLATVDAVTGTKGPRKIAVGFETFPATSAVGVMGSQGGAYMTFNSPLAVNPGEYLHFVARNFGAVTTTGVISVLVSVDSYWE